MLWRHWHSGIAAWVGTCTALGLVLEDGDGAYCDTTMAVLRERTINALYTSEVVQIASVMDMMHRKRVLKTINSPLVDLVIALPASTVVPFDPSTDACSSRD